MLEQEWQVVRLLLVGRMTILSFIFTDRDFLKQRYDISVNMKKAWTLLLCAAWLAFTASVAHAREVKVAVDAEYVPFEFVDSDGQVKGFLPDLLREIGRTSGLTFRFIPMSWPAAVKGLKSGKVDLINMIRTPDRADKYEFSDPHSGISQALFRNTAFHDIDGVDSISGRSVILQKNDIATEKLADRNDFERVMVHDKKEGFLKLNSGKAQAFFTAEQPGLYFIRQHDLDHVELAEVNLWSQEYCFTAKKGNREIIALLNSGLAELKASGRYDEIFNQWMIKTENWFERNGRSILVAALILFALFLLLFMWNVLLRRSVERQTADLHKSEEVIRTLYRISTESQGGLAHQIRSLLELGCSRFNMEIGILSRISGDDYKVIYRHCPPETGLSEGSHFELGRTYCAATIEANGPVLFEHVKESSMQAHPAYQDFGLEAYIGTPVVVRGNVFGTLNFSSSIPVEKKIEDVDIDALQLMASWIGSELARREQETELLQSQKMEAVGTLVGGIAHDFNNTLAAIQGNLYLAKQKFDEKEVVATKLDNIERLGGHAATMVKQLLAFARKGPVSMKPISMTTFMNKELRLSRSVLPENIGFVSHICHEQLTVLADSTQLQQVLLNLLSNARDAVCDVADPQVRCVLEAYSPTPAFIEKHPQLKGKEFAHLTISDNGCGMTEDVAGNIFEPFFTTKAIGKGSGLGLSMVYGSVQSHGGVVEVDSRPGEGAEFHVYLPLCVDEEPLTDDTTISQVEGKGETLLLADDEADVLASSSEALRSMGYHVVTANDGEMAVMQFKEHVDEISLVITDVVMPKLGGVEAVEQMRRHKPDLPAVFATGYDKQQAAGTLDKIARSETISKPFSFEFLGSLIRKLIDR